MTRRIVVHVDRIAVRDVADVERRDVEDAIRRQVETSLGAAAPAPRRLPAAGAGAGAGTPGTVVADRIGASVAKRVSAAVRR